MWPGMSTRKNSSGDSETVVTRSALEEEPLALGEDEGLLPDRPGLLVRRVGDVPAVARPDGREAVADGDAGGQRLRLGADLRPLDVPLGDLAVDGVVELVLALRDRLAGRGRFEQEVDDAQAEAEVAGPGRLVDERPGGDARDVALGRDGGASSGRSRSTIRPAGGVRSTLTNGLRSRRSVRIGGGLLVEESPDLGTAGRASASLGPGSA